MNTFKHILVPTDFGEPSERALDMAVALAQKLEARITLLHAYEVPNYGYGTFLYRASEVEEGMRDAATQKLGEALARLKQRHATADSLLRHGNPWEQVLAVIDQIGIDLVVMGTHARRGLRRALLGSVAEKTVRLSPVPVLTVHVEAPDEPAHATSAGTHT